MIKLKKLEQFRELEGYLGAGVFSPEGEMLAGVTEAAGVSFEIAGKLFHDGYLILNNNSKEAGFGPINMIQVNTETGIVFGKCYKEDDIHFHVILVVRKDTDVARAKLMMSKVIESLLEEFEAESENWALPRKKK